MRIRLVWPALPLLSLFVGCGFLQQGPSAPDETSPTATSEVENDAPRVIKFSKKRIPKPMPYPPKIAD